MDGVKVIAKGGYTYSQIKDCVTLKQYIYADVSGSKRLLLNFRNDNDERLDRLRFIVTFFDDFGTLISAKTFDAGALSVAPKAEFSVDAGIEPPKGWNDFKLTIVSAVYGNRVVFDADGDRAVRFEKKKPAYVPDRSTVSHLGKSGSAVKVKNPIKTFTIGLIALIFIVAATLANTIFLLIYKAEPEEGFIIDGVQYAFATDDKTEGADVYIYGYFGNSEELVIDGEIEGYSVIGVKDGAFRYNDKITSLKYSARCAIPKNAFYECKRLETVEISNTLAVETSAFYGCENLKSVKINNVGNIGEYAFGKCANLLSAEITSDDQDARVVIYGGAFADCRALETFKVSVWAEYRNGEKILSADTSVKELSLKNFGVADSGNAAQNRIRDLFGNTDYYSPSLKTLNIENLGGIGNDFCAGLNDLEELTVGELVSPEIGNRAFSGCGSLTKLDIPLSVTAIGKNAFKDCAISELSTARVTYFGEGAFDGCANLTSVSISSEVEDILPATFKGCESLSRVTFADGSAVKEIGDEAFSGCSLLRNINLPKDIVSIGSSAFKNCSSLEYLGELSAVTEFGESAFDGCKNLKSVNIYANLESIPKRLFAGCERMSEIVIPATVTEIGDEAFSGCKSVINFDLPENLKKLGSGVFSGCSALFGLEIPLGVTEIPDGTFKNCSSISSYVLPDNVVTVGNNAFAGCSALKKIEFGLNATEIGSGVLDNCTALEEIVIPDFGGRSYIGYLFGAANAAQNGERLPESLKKVTLTNMGSLSGTGFTDCRYIEEVILGNVTNIESGAFDNCTALSSVTLSERVSSISVSAFTNCTSLFEIINHSALSITPQSGENGYIGYRAVAVLDGETNDRVEKYQTGYYTFAYDPVGKEYYLVGHDKGSESVIDLSRKFALSDTVSANSFFVATEAFCGDESITSVVLGKVVKGVGVRAFENDTSLSSLKMSSTSVERIGDYAFYMCESLSEVYLDVTVKEIGEYAFCSCASLQTAYFYGAEYIGRFAFGDCSALSDLYLGDSIETIGECAFIGCCSIERVTLPATLSYIGERAFDEDYFLHEIYNLSSMRLTKGSSGYGCVAKYALTIHTDESDYSLSVIKYGNCTFKYDMYAGKLYLTGVTEGTETLTLGRVRLTGVYTGEYDIAPYALRNDTAIRKLVLTDGVKAVGDYAFYGSSIEEIDALNSSLETIGEYAFAQNYSLNKVYLPSSITAIDFSAFTSDYSLSEVYYYGSQAEADELALSDKFYCSVYTYTDCIHEYGDYWMFDQSGEPVRTNPYKESLVTVKQPSCEIAGEMRATCRHCGHIRYETIDPLGHDHKATETVEPTCKTEGYTRYTCERCGDTYFDYSGYADHKIDASGKCSVCGKTVLKITESNFKTDTHIKDDATYAFNVQGNVITATNFTRLTDSAFTVKPTKSTEIRLSWKLNGRSSTNYGYIEINGEKVYTTYDNYFTEISVTVKAGDSVKIGYYSGTSSYYSANVLVIQDLTLTY